MRVSPSAERIGRGACPLPRDNETSPTVTLPQRGSNDTLARSTEGPETDFCSINLSGPEGHARNLDGRASPIHFRACGKAAKGKASQSWCRPYYGASREEPLRTQDRRPKHNRCRSSIHPGRQKATTINNSGVSAIRSVAHTPLRSCDTSGTIPRSHSTQSAVASTEDYAVLGAAPPRTRRQTLSVAVKHGDEFGEAREQLSRREHVSARKNRAASAQGSRSKMPATVRMRSQIVSASAANRRACKHEGFENVDVEAEENCIWKAGRSQLYPTRLSSAKIEHSWRPPSPLSIRPPSRQKEAFPKHLTTMEDDKDVSSTLGSDDATISHCQLLSSSPHSSIAMADDYCGDEDFVAPSSLQSRAQLSERAIVDSHQSISYLDDGDSFSAGGIQKQCRLDQIHDPEADGFAMLDELAPCPFKIQVTPNDGSPLQLKDLGAVAAKSPLLFPESGPSRILVANMSHNNLLSSSELSPDDAVHALVSAKRRYSARREITPYSSRKSLTYHPRSNNGSTPTSGDRSSGVHNADHAKNRDNTPSPFSFLEEDSEDILFADSSASTFHDCASSAIFDTNIGDDFLSLFAPPDAVS